MTSSEPLLPVPEDDALDAAASAVVDGVATPEEAAAVAAAPDGAARVAALRAVADAVGSGAGAQRPAAAERARAAALAAFDVQGAAVAAPPAAGAPVSRFPPPASERNRRLYRIGTVAAALLLLVGIGAFAAAVLGSDGDSQETSTAAAPGAQDAARARSGASTLEAGNPALAGPAPTVPPSGPLAEAPAPGAPAVPAPPVQPPPVVNGGDLGRQDDVEALAQRAAAALDGEPDAAVAAPNAAPPRDVQACAGAGGAAVNETVGALRYRAVGTFQGTPAVFLVFDRVSNPPRLLLVLARADCSVLASTHF